MTRICILNIALVLLFLSKTALSSDQPIELTIFHTNDLHSRMTPPKTDEFNFGGLARLSSLLTKLREDRSISVTLDAGDWSEGSWPYSIDTGANMLRILDQMGFDAVVVGNHDYLSGPDRLFKTVSEAATKFPILASNLDFSMYERTSDFTKRILPTAILERSGLKIGVIGLTTPDLIYASFLLPVTVTSALEEAKTKVAELRPQVDVLLVLSHNDFSKNVEIARTVPGIDAVISGHSHKKVSKALLVENSGRQIPVVEAGKWGAFLGDLVLSVDQANKFVKFLRYKLHPVLPALSADIQIEALVQTERDKLSKLYGSDINAKIAESEIELDDSDSHAAGLGDLTTQAYRFATHADAGVEIMALTGMTTPVGALTVEALHDAMPHILNFATGKEWTVKTTNLRGVDLAVVLNLFYAIPNGVLYGATGSLALDGIQTIWQPETDAKGLHKPRIVGVAMNGQPLDPKRRYRVAMTDGTLGIILAANRIYGLQLDLSQIVDSGIEAWRAVLVYAKHVGNFTAEGLKASRSGAVSTIADPAIYRYGLTLTEEGLEAIVSNEGLKKSEPARLTCSAGEANDLVSYDTDAEILNSIGEAAVPALDAGAKITVRIPWKPSRSGYWPIDCSVTSSVDAYLANSHARRVFAVKTTP